VAVVGLHGGVPYGEAAVRVLKEATVVVGSARHLEGAPIPDASSRVLLEGPLDPILDALTAHRQSGQHVCVLSSGDPGFFGIVRLLGERLGADALEVHPAPSSVALAFARLGLSWEDATVVSAHGRPLERAVPVVCRSAKAAVLTSPTNPPEVLGKALLDAGCGARQVSVATRVAEPQETVVRTDLEGLAGGVFDPMSVVVLVAADGPAAVMGLAWGLAESAFEHRDGMITKAEVRAVTLGKLTLPATGVLWDVGAGSGSVGVEAARLSPGLRVFAVERDSDQARRIGVNAEAHGVEVEVVAGVAPTVFADLPDPDRAFVGGGGIDVLDAVLGRLRPGGTVVTNHALVDRAVEAHARLGNLVQLSVSRGVPIADGVRLDGQNPVFVCWGPS
jgi:precorrin-6Y C5,15-methyltransferase (decarboxylating)